MREALVNAARHAGSGRVDVYAEASPSQLEVFVKDRGRGFDPETVAADRHGAAAAGFDDALFYEYFSGSRPELEQTRVAIENSRISRIS